MQKSTTKNMVFCAMIAALYTALCVALAPLSYGMVQIRAAEALTLLPVLSPIAVWGVTLGCALSNLIGFFTGANILGFLDIFFGTAATLLAAMCSYKLRRVQLWGLPVAAAVPPVVFNAVVIGLELTFLEMGSFHPGVFLTQAAFVGAGQAVSCFGLGLPLVWLLRKAGADRALCVETGNKLRDR